MRFPSNLGMFLLGIWVTLMGVIPLLSASSITLSSGTLMSVLAIVAGICILLKR